jgi:hypothetical protein
MSAGRAGDAAHLRGWAPALLALNLVLRLVVALRPPHVVDDLAIPDDAYLSLTLARNIARGLGPLYGLDPTNGFQPLYVFLMAPVFRWVTHDPYTALRVALVFLVLCDTLALGLMLRWVARTSTWRWTPALFGLAWAFNPYAIVTSLNGLETSLSFCGVIGLFAMFAGMRERPERFGSWRAAVLFGALLGLAVLARIDNLLVVPALAAVAVVMIARGELRAEIAARWAATAALAAFTVCLPWLLYSWNYTGQLFPVSGRAVRYWALTQVDHRPTWSNFYAPMLRQAAGVVVRKNAIALVVIGVALAGIVVRLRGQAARAVLLRWRPLVPLALYGALLVTAYSGFIFGYWHLPRYLFPLALLFWLAAFALVDLWVGGVPSASMRRVLGTGAAALVVAGSMLQPSFGRVYTPRVYGTWGYMRVGEWAQTRFPAGTMSTRVLRRLARGREPRRRGQRGLLRSAHQEALLVLHPQRGRPLHHLAGRHRAHRSRVAWIQA